MRRGGGGEEEGRRRGGGGEEEGRRRGGGGEEEGRRRRVGREEGRGRGGGLPFNTICPGHLGGPDLIKHVSSQHDSMSSW